MPGSPGHRNGGNRGKDHGQGSESDPRSAAHRKMMKEVKKEREEREKKLTEEQRKQYQVKFPYASLLAERDNAEAMNKLVEVRMRETNCTKEEAAAYWHDFIPVPSDTEEEAEKDESFVDLECEENGDPHAAESQNGSAGGRTRGRARGSKSPPYAGPQNANGDDEGEMTEQRRLEKLLETLERVKVERKAVSTTKEHKETYTLLDDLLVTLAREQRQETGCDYNKACREWEYFVERAQLADQIEDDSESEGEDDDDEASQRSDTDDFWAQKEREEKEWEKKAMLKMHKDNLLDERAQRKQAAEGGDFRAIRAKLAAADDPSARTSAATASQPSADVHARFESLYADPFSSSQSAETTAATSSQSARTGRGPLNKPPSGRRQHDLMRQLREQRAAAVNVGSTAGHEGSGFYGTRQSSAESPAVSSPWSNFGGRQRLKSGYSATSPSPPAGSTSGLLLGPRDVLDATGQALRRQQEREKAASRVVTHPKEQAAFIRQRLEFRERIDEAWKLRASAGPVATAAFDRGVREPSDIIPLRRRRGEVSEGHVAAAAKVPEVGKQSGRPKAGVVEPVAGGSVSATIAAKVKQLSYKYALIPPPPPKHPRKSVVHPSNPLESQPRMLAPATLSGSVAATSGPRLPRGPTTPPEVETAASTPIVSQVVGLSAAVDATKSPESASTTQFAVKATPVTPGSSATVTATSTSPGFDVPPNLVSAAAISPDPSTVAVSPDASEHEFVNVKVLEEPTATVTMSTVADVASTSRLTPVVMSTSSGLAGGAFFSLEQVLEREAALRATLTADIDRKMEERLKKFQDETVDRMIVKKMLEKNQEQDAIAASYRQQPVPMVPSGAPSVEEAGDGPSTSTATPPRATRRLNTSAVPAVSASSRSTKRSQSVGALKQKALSEEEEEVPTVHFELADRDETLATLFHAYWDDPRVMQFLPILEMRTRNQKLVDVETLTFDLVNMIGAQQRRIEEANRKGMLKRYQSDALAIEWLYQYEAHISKQKKRRKTGQELIDHLHQFMLDVKKQLRDIKAQEQAAAAANLGEELPPTPRTPRRKSTVAAPVKVEAQSANVEGRDRALRHRRSHSLSQHSSAASDADARPRFYNNDVSPDPRDYYDDRNGLAPPHPDDRNELPDDMTEVPEIRLGGKTTDFGCQDIYYAMGIDAQDWAKLKAFLDEHLRQQLRLCAKTDNPFTDPHYLAPDERVQYRRYLNNIDGVTINDIDHLPPACVVPAMFANWRQLRDSVKNKQCQALRRCGAGVFRFDAAELRNIMGFTNASEIDIAKVVPAQTLTHVPENSATPVTRNIVAGSPSFHEMKAAQSGERDAYYMIEITAKMPPAMKRPPKTLEDVRKAFYYKVYDKAETEKQYQQADFDSVKKLLNADAPERLELPESFIDETWKEVPNIKEEDSAWWDWLHETIVVKKKRVIFAQYLDIPFSFINTQQTVCHFDQTNRHGFMQKMFGQFAPVNRAQSQIRPGPGPCYTNHHENGRLTSFNMCLAGGMLHYFAPACDVDKIRQYEREVLYKEEYKSKAEGGKFCENYFQHHGLVYRPTHWLKAGAHVSVIHQKPGDLLAIHDGTIHVGFADGARITLNVSWNQLEPLWFVCQKDDVFAARVCDCPENQHQVTVENHIFDRADAILDAESADQSAFFTTDTANACAPCGLNPDWFSGDKSQRKVNHHKAWKGVKGETPRTDSCDYVVGRFSANQRTNLNEAHRMLLVEQNRKKAIQRDEANRSGTESKQRLIVKFSKAAIEEKRAAAEKKRKHKVLSEDTSDEDADYHPPTERRNRGGRATRMMLGQIAGGSDDDESEVPLAEVKRAEEKKAEKKRKRKHRKDSSGQAVIMSYEEKKKADEKMAEGDEEQPDEYGVVGSSFARKMAIRDMQQDPNLQPAVDLNSAECLETAARYKAAGRFLEPGDFESNGSSDSDSTNTPIVDDDEPMRHVIRQRPRIPGVVSVEQNGGDSSDSQADAFDQANDENDHNEHVMERGLANGDDAEVSGEGSEAAGGSPDGAHNVDEDMEETSDVDLSATWADATAMPENIMEDQ